MSVSDFGNHPCPVCKSDTLHYQLKCSICGHEIPSLFSDEQPKIVPITKKLRVPLSALTRFKRRH